MSIITFFHDMRALSKAAGRIADALERIAPLPEEPVELKPEDALTYVDEDRIAADELRTEVEKEYARVRAEEQGEEADGGLGIYGGDDL